MPHLGHAGLQPAGVLRRAAGRRVARLRRRRHDGRHQSHTQRTDPSAFSAQCTTEIAALCVLQVNTGSLDETNEALGQLQEQLAAHVQAGAAAEAEEAEE